MKDEANYVCDACGEEIVVPIDLSAGTEQEFLQEGESWLEPKGEMVIAAWPEERQSDQCELCGRRKSLTEHPEWSSLRKCAVSCLGLRESLF